MDICLIQTDPSEGYKNLDVLRNVVQNISADIYVFPELFLTGFDGAIRNWPLGAEQFARGPTYQQILGCLRSRRSVVICGMLEQNGADFYNIAAVIQDGHADWYRQKYPATINGRKALAINRGAQKHVKLLCGWSVGLMICSDHFSAAEFFETYEREGVDAVVLIADSPSRSWIRGFPELCQKHGMVAIVCNAASKRMKSACRSSSSLSSLRERPSSSGMNTLYRRLRNMTVRVSR